MARHGWMRGCIFSLLIIAAFKGGAADSAGSGARQAQTDLTLLLLQDNFDKLDQAFAQLRADTSRDDMHVSPLARAYENIQYSPELLPHVDQWCQHSPQQSFPWIIKARLYIDHAWAVRGGAAAQDVRPGAWPKFEARLKQAQTCLEKAMPLDPKDPDPPARMIVVAMGLSLDRPQMEEYFKKAVAIDPTYMPAYRAKMQYLSPLWHGSVEEMMAFAQTCLVNSPPHSRVYLAFMTACDELVKVSPKRNAIYQIPEIWNVVNLIYRRALKEFNNNNHDLNQFACYAMYANQTAMAQSLFKQIGARMDPEAWLSIESFLYQRARAFEPSGKQEAISRQLELFLPEINALIASEPQVADHYYLRAVAYKETADIYHVSRRKDDKIYAALDDYARVIQLDPRNAEAYAGAAMLYENILQKPEKALEIYDQALANQVSIGWASSAKGNCLFELKRYEPALACLEKSMENNLNNIFVASKVSTCYYQLKRYEDGIRFAERVRQNASNFPRRPIVMLVTSNDPKEAARQKAESQRDADREGFDAIYTNEACCLFELKRYKEAAARFAQTIEFAPKYAPALHHYAMFLLNCPDPAQRNPVQALAMAKECMKYWDHKDPEMLVTLGQAYEANKQPDLAAEQYQAALNLKPGDTKIENQLRNLKK